jgi:asparagine synthase/glutamine amidotransferase-like protein
MPRKSRSVNERKLQSHELRRGRSRIPPDNSMNYPAFIGFIGPESQNRSRPFPEFGPEWEIAFDLGAPRAKLWVNTLNSSNLCCWNAAPTCPRQPIVFVWGHPLLASDASFSVHTQVRRIEPADLPFRIARLYQQHGTDAFALLDGNFCLALADPESKSVFLVVDKFGCEDISIRQLGCGLAFASQPALLAGAHARFNPIATAFFLAHEGFIPAPFTIFESVETVERARFLKIQERGRGLNIESRRYWRPSRESDELARNKPVGEFSPLLDAAVQPRLRAGNGILLSGGIDSALLANLLAGREPERLLAVTGSVRGHLESEQDSEAARELSTALGIAHRAVCVDPEDEALPDEWRACCESWTGGLRTTLPVFYRMAAELNSHLGTDYSAFSGQMADTLADNNYTLPSAGYTIRRLLFSPIFLRLMPLLRAIALNKDGVAGRILARTGGACAGRRTASMIASMLDGLSDKEHFYAGRVFGFGEMPGVARNAFPLLSARGFESVWEWYAANSIMPVVSRLTPATFYREMLELSLDMCMLHLDTRLVFHAVRLGGGHAEMPYLDSRIVNLFINLPYRLRAFYRRPKYIIRKQFTRHGFLYSRPRSASKPTAPATHEGRSHSFETLLLGGALGHYFRELLKSPTALAGTPQLFEFVNEKYLERQRHSFLRGQTETDHKLISRLAALELWSRHLKRAAAPADLVLARA